MNRQFHLIVCSLLLYYLGACTDKEQKLFDISDFGAVTDSLVINTEAIQSAIDKCAEEGGGTVVVPEGTFISGAIFLKRGC